MRRCSLAVERLTRNEKVPSSILGSGFYVLLSRWVDLFYGRFHSIFLFFFFFYFLGFDALPKALHNPPSGFGAAAPSPPEQGSQQGERSHALAARLALKNTHQCRAPLLRGTCLIASEQSLGQHDHLLPCRI